MANIRATLDRQARQYGAQVIDVRIKRADLPDGTPLDSAYERMRTARLQEARKMGFARVILPRGNGLEVVVAVARTDKLSPWCLARLGEALPEGSYRLAEGARGGRGRGGARRHVCLLRRGRVGPVQGVLLLLVAPLVGIPFHAGGMGLAVVALFLIACLAPNTQE